MELDGLGGEEWLAMELEVSFISIKLLAISNQYNMPVVHSIPCHRAREEASWHNDPIQVISAGGRPSSRRTVCRTTGTLYSGARERM